jgi:hypothetical protein
MHDKLRGRISQENNQAVSAKTGTNIKTAIKIQKYFMMGLLGGYFL